MNLQQATSFVAEHSDDDELNHADVDAAFTAIFGRTPDDQDRNNGLWSMMVAACDDDGGDDEEDEPSRQKFITINDDIDCWGSVEPDFDLDDEIRKIVDAAESAGITVYENSEPTYEIRDEGTEIDWFTEWCGVADLWSESQWVEWFRKQ